MTRVERQNPPVVSARPSRVLLFNLATDADHPILAFTTSWISTLAARVEAMDVVTMRAGTFHPPPNVRVFSVGKEEGFSEARRAVNFYRILIQLLLQHRYSFAFAHMMPLFAVMAAPLLKMRRTPIILWYAHGATPRLLRIAEKVVDRVVTASPHSFRVPTKKLVVTGHGIDTGLFCPVPNLDVAVPPTIVTVGRLSPIKRLEVLVEATKLLVDAGRSDLRLLIAGPRYDQAYAARVEEQVRREKLDTVVTFVGQQPREQVVELLRRAAVMVNVSDTDSTDKAVLEAMSCSVPVVTTNAAFRELFYQLGVSTFHVPKDSPGTLAQAIATVLDLDPEERRTIGSRLRDYVVEEHDLDRLVGALLSEARRL